MNSMELPLVLFTVLSQLAIGLVLMSVVRGAATTAGSTSAGEAKNEWLIAGGLLFVSLIASLFHLGHPTGAPMAISNLGVSWLSREALVFGALLALILVTAFTGLSSALARITAVVGVLGLLVQGMTYAPPSYPAINNALPFVFFTVYAVVLGAGFGSYFAPADKQPLMARTLTGGLVVGLVVFLVAPCVWLSGGTVMEMTAHGWLSSPLYWVHVLAGLAVPLMAVWRTGRVDPWVPAVLLAGALAGRIVFYQETIHTAANMGGMY